MNLESEALFILVIACMLAMSALLFVLMGVDKRRAKAGKWRVPEKTLFLIAFLGGAPGGILGMRAFRHKTKHASFTIGMPLLLLLNIGAAFLLLRFLASA